MCDTKLPTVSITMATLAGLVSETKENAGINTLLSKIIPKGTNTKTAKEIADTMDSLGASFGLSCGNNTTLTSASCLRDDLSIVLETLSDIIQNPSLPPDALEREREAMIAGIKEQDQDPLSVAFNGMRSALFGENGYGLRNHGTEESLNSLTRESLAAHHKEYFTAANSVLAIFGDIDADEVIAQVEQFFGTMESGKRMTAPAVTYPEPAEINEQLDKQQAVLTIGFPGASASDDDNHALELIHDYCTDMAGPLFTKIREELGLAYYVSATQFHGINTGMFAFYMGTSPDQLDTAREVLLGEIKKIADYGIPGDTLESVKTTWLASHALENQKIGSLARLSAIDVLLGFPADHHTQAPDNIRALSAEQIKAAAEKYLGKRQPVIVTVSPDA
jgi:zinc protease